MTATFELLADGTEREIEIAERESCDLLGGRLTDDFEY